MQSRARASIPIASEQARAGARKPSKGSARGTRGSAPLPKSPIEGKDARTLGTAIARRTARRAVLLPSAMQRSAGEIRARRRTRRAVMIAYYAVVAAFIVLAAGNVTWQIWSPRFRRHAPIDCATGLETLKQSVARARQAAGELTDASEDAALSRFRRALLPEWEERDTIAAACQSNDELASALDVIERLRYAEERAVRREVSELAPLRRRVEQLRTSPSPP
jgi:hypothetical protein